MVITSGFADDYSNVYNLKQQYVQAFALSTLGFLIPVMFGHPQLLVGVLVNAFIIRAALTLPASRSWPLVFTPVLGALSRGLLFGPFTPFLLYMVPFIWAGNYILLWAFSRRVTGKFGYALTLGASSVAKAALLYSSAFILFNAGLVPAVLLPSMGVFQLVTALAGGVLAYGSLKAERLLH